MPILTTILEIYTPISTHALTYASATDPSLEACMCPEISYARFPCSKNFSFTNQWILSLVVVPDSSLSFAR